MTTLLMAKTTRALATLAALGSTLLVPSLWAAEFPITPAQQATANDVAAKGVALADIAPNAPARYTIKSGDTLWSISTMYLKSPWRWPELWGMNLSDLHNPHRIYPGQILVLERGDSGATLRLAGATTSGGGDSMGSAGTSVGNNSMPEAPAVHISPRVRSTSLLSDALPALPPNVVEPFLVEPLVVDESTFESAPRIVSGKEGRQILSKGDRAYAVGNTADALMDDGLSDKSFRIYGSGTRLIDPDNKQVIGYEVQLQGVAMLAKGQTRQAVADEDGKSHEEITAAALDIISANDAIHRGDRLLVPPPRPSNAYVPHAAAANLKARVVSIYGSAVRNAAQNQVVAINRGTSDGLDVGAVLAILSDGRTLDESDGINPTEGGPAIRLPDERIGLLMVFRTFEHVSYGLIVEIVDGVRVGDRLISPL